jgi:cyclopropane fatty-acyl-phospholipid synthase-like methyltransferase
MPQEVVDRILTLAGVKNGDLLYDLGSGDGRVLIAAAKRYGAEQWALRLIRDW